MREDLLLEVARLAKEGRFDYLLIESTGISEPMPVAETFTFEDEEGQSLSHLARLDTLVTVVDAIAFLRDFLGGEELIDRDLGVSEDDERNISDLLADQIEFANVIVLNKCDRASESQIHLLEGFIHRLNPAADIVHSSWGRVPLDKVLATGKFDFETASQAPGWLQELRGQHTSETEEYGIASFVYRARRPFHPMRFWDYCHQEWAGVLRAKGFLWLATRHTMAGLFSLAGNDVTVEAAGEWWAAVPRGDWPMESFEYAELAHNWKEPWGDRRQELVIIGHGMSEAALRVGFDACLLTNAEMQLDPKGWQEWEDPFASWDDEEEAELTSNHELNRML